MFEATLLLRLGSTVPDAPLLAAVLSYRVISTLADVVAALLDAGCDVAACGWDGDDCGVGSGPGPRGGRS